MVLFGFKTVNQGQSAIVWTHTGRSKIVVGPARLRLWRSHADILSKVVAGQGESIQYQTVGGERRVLPGPATL